MDYFAWAAGSPPARSIRVRHDDPLARTFRTALAARRLGWDDARTVEAMEREQPGITSGLEVVEGVAQ